LNARNQIANKYMEVIMQNYNESELLQFLNKTIPGMDRISAVNRSKI